MGPKKEVKKDAQKRDQNNIDEPLNTNSWRCVVVMAVEKSSFDTFVLREFLEEYSNGRRQEIGLIDFDVLVKTLTDFATGDLSHKHPTLLTFSTVLQEASEYVTKRMDIPVPLLVKVVKAFLFHLREESLIRIEKKAAGPQDPIAAMAERPASFGLRDPKRKEQTKKTENAPPVRPSTVTKQDTRLLKRGEPVKDEQRIDDAPLDGYFNLYVLLTGFRLPDLPLELIKGGVPLHGLLCIDTSASVLTRQPSLTRQRSPKQDSDATSDDIQTFWDVFLKILWDPEASPFFKDTIFQVYVPRSLRCCKKKLGEFIYQEISYLMYDLSDVKRKLNNYLHKLKLWDVEETEIDRNLFPVVPENIPNECTTVPMVLQFMIDNLCGKDVQYQLNLSADSIDSVGGEGGSYEGTLSISAKAWCRSSVMQPRWSQVLSTRRDFDLLRVYSKIKALDAEYDLDNKRFSSQSSDRENFDDSSVEGCEIQFKSCGENMQAALAPDGALRSYWKSHDRHAGPLFALDYCLYPLLLSKVFCPYLASPPTPPTPPNLSSKTNSHFQLIQNIATQMRKPHFTVTDCSRSVLKALPYNLKNTSRDFFCPLEFKIVSPEKLKASSAPQFRVAPPLNVRTTFASQVFSGETSKNLFGSLKDFLGEWLFTNANGFFFLELLGKQQLLERQTKQWDSYNCVDHTYSVLNDCIFLVLHNRMDGQNVHHETFNQDLKTNVGLRDFYEYVLEDESEWFAGQETAHAADTREDASSPGEALPEFSESDFWLLNSIKYGEGSRVGRRRGVKGGEAGAGGGGREKGVSGEEVGGGEGVGWGGSGEQYAFEGYNVSDRAVQFSGLKTEYCSNECKMRVELIERLYGDQDLGIHVAAAGHTLHLYSYVCPEPHVLEPFTFHVTYANGVVVAFGRRFIETFEEVEEVVESRTPVKGKKNSCELSTTVVKRMIPKTVRDEEFAYDMSASLPNGLLIRTVRRLVEPCYVKQQHLDNSEGSAHLERCRLFLPNGSVVRMLNDGTVVILRPDASVVTASLDDLTKGDAGFHFTAFHAVSSEGFAYTSTNGTQSSPERYQILQNTDVDTNQQYFRRRDGTKYLLQNDGALCVEFSDGTRISSSAFVAEEEPEDDSKSQEAPEKEDFELDFVFVCTTIVMEHPAYATAIHDSHSHRWTLLLPQESTIKVESNGQYAVDVDKRTEVKVEAGAVQMNSFLSGRRLACATTADFSVFENGEGGVYCHMEDLNGKIFIVEANSNCYILDDQPVSEPSESPESSPEVCSQQSDVSEFVASADLQCSPSVLTEKTTKLSRNNKYFVMKRDLTGFELLHEDDVNEIFSEKKKGSFVFTETLPGSENRVFVLITPEKSQTNKKWQVDSILPDPTYVPNARNRQTSSTYGSPPSWTHPFPKRKFQFLLPELFACRVFIETKTTEFSPPPGEIETTFCEVEEPTEVHSRIAPDGAEDHLNKLANNDQDVLREMYAIEVNSLVNRKKNLNATHSKKLEHYLSLSRHYVEVQEYHKRCIRYHLPPNYFHHPVGMSWLILNGLINENRAFDAESEGRPPSEEAARTTERWRESSRGTDVFSNEEIEYNLSRSEAVSFSDLSYRSDLSPRTAPAVLRTGGLCRCKVSPTKNAASSPLVKCCWQEEPSTLDTEDFRSRECDFQEKEYEMLGREERQVLPMTLEDLMCLGLI